MNTKQKVRYYLEKFSHLRDNDYRLCSNIWHEEFKTFDINGDLSAQDFLKIYSLGKLTSAYNADTFKVVNILVQDLTKKIVRYNA